MTAVGDMSLSIIKDLIETLSAPLLWASEPDYRLKGGCSNQSNGQHNTTHHITALHNKRLASPPNECCLDLFAPLHQLFIKSWNFFCLRITFCGKISKTPFNTCFSVVCCTAEFVLVGSIVSSLETISTDQNSHITAKHYLH